MEKYQILLYYNYTNIEDPTRLMDEQRALCQELGLKGRIIISKEGVNGTLEGTVENTEKYVEDFLNHSEFADTHFKKSVGTGNAFPKLSIKVRDEVVSGHLGDWDVNPREVTGKYITAEELNKLIHSDEEFYIIDMRNDYEHRVGFFKDSILPNLSNFRDLPNILPEIENLKDKKVITVCTGGIRCEKASGFLVKHGFKDVSQLFGGIVTYMEKYPNEDFLGQLYVFDGRVTMGFNIDSPDHVIVGRCDKCGAPSERYVNCSNNACHKHFITCDNCVGEKIYCSACELVYA